ncbi:MAG: tetratricopeptide repeat protein, partial [Polyangiales bacterium]
MPDNERAEAAELLVNMAQMYDGEHALAYSEAALDAQPGHDRAMQLAAHYAGQLGRDVTERWAGYVKASPDGGLAFEGRKTLARTYEQQGRIDDAIKALEPVKDDPDPSIMVRLGDLYAKAGNTTALAQHMDRHAASLPPHERISKVLEIAALLAQKNDKKGALAKYREVLEMDPQHPEALAYVEDQLRSTRQYRELRDLLLNAARVSSASVESRKSQLREVAGLSEQQLKDPEGAITAYRQ